MNKSNINTSFSPSIYNSNKGNSTNNDCSDSRTVQLYNKLRTAITQIKNSKAKRNQEPTCSFEEAYKAALIIAKDNQLNKGMLPNNEIVATTRCTLKWVNANWKPFEKDSSRCSANMDKVREFEKQIKCMDFIILHGRITEEKLNRKKLGLSTSTRAIADAVGVTAKTVSIHNRKTEAELYEYVMSAGQLAARLVDCSKDSELFRKYSKKVEQYNYFITIYNSSFFSSIYNSNKGNSTKSTTTNSSTTAETTAETTTETTQTDKTTATNTTTIIHKYATWNEFCQSNIVCNQLRRRPRPKDWLDYKHNILTIREDY